MKKILNFLPPLFMAVMIGILFVCYDVAHINTELVLTGISKSPLAVKTIVIGLFLGAMLCIPTFCLMVNEHTILSCLYCVIVLVGTILGKENFWEIVLMGFSLLGMFLGSITEIVIWIIRLFFQGFSGSWICAIMQMVGHALTVGVLCFPLEALEGSSSSHSADNGSDSSNSTGKIYFDYNEEVRQMREKEQLETLKRIERDLRYK